MLYDILIAGGGVAGLTAAMYAQRSGLTALVVERLFPGGQAALTYEIENYPGLQAMTGPDLALAFEQHARKCGAMIVNAEINSVELEGQPKLFKTSEGDFTGRAVIITTGARPRLLGIDGERELTGRGVSYCATCDGAFFRGKNVAVIGGGNTAVEDALFLARMCETVNLIHRRDQFRADKRLSERLADFDNIKLMMNTVPEYIQGQEHVTGLAVQNKETDEKHVIALDGVFVAVGTVPNNSLFSDMLATEGGYIVTDKYMRASIPGVFAAGDIRNTPLRQVITAASDGAVAAYSASEYLLELRVES